MSRWMVQLGEMITPVIDDMLEQIKLQPYVQIDETTVREFWIIILNQVRVICGYITISQLGVYFSIRRIDLGLML